ARFVSRGWRSGHDRAFHRAAHGPTLTSREDVMSLFPRPLRFWTALLLLGYWCALEAAPAAAGLAPSQTVGAAAYSRAQDLAAVERALENRIVARKLRDYGVSPAEVKVRLAALSEPDLHTLATASRGLPSGGDAVGALIGVLIVVLLVILILKLLNQEIIIKLSSLRVA